MATNPIGVSAERPVARRRFLDLTSGAYRFVRHPIYASLFIGLLALVLRTYTPLNLAAALVCAALFMIKCWVEEYFLRADPDYAAYLRQVRWRWIPGIA